MEWQMCQGECHMSTAQISGQAGGFGHQTLTLSGSLFARIPQQSVGSRLEQNFFILAMCEISHCISFSL